MPWRQEIVLAGVPGRHHSKSGIDMLHKMHTVPVLYRRCFGRILALAAVVGLLAMSAPTSSIAHADPGTVVDAPTLALTDLGSDPSLAFYGLDGTVQLTVPVLRGLRPTALNATVELPVNLKSGTIIVTQSTQNDRTIASLNLPATDQAPIVIPLSGAEVIDNSVTVTLRARLVPAEGICLYPWSPLRLTDGMVSYTGVEQPPTTVAHFLPPVLRKLSIFLPQAPSATESDAAIRLAAAAASHYGKQAPEIAVMPLGEGQQAPPTPSRPLERQVVIKEGPDDELTLQGATGVPWLLVSGPLLRTDESDTALLFGDLVQLAASSKAVVEGLKSNRQLPGNTATLRELGQPFVNSTAMQPRVSIGLDQTRFGRSVEGVRLHLKGSYSPTPPNAGGRIVATIGPETIDHWPTDGQGVIDRWVDVPDRLLQRFTSVDLTLDIAGRVGHCGDFYTIGAGDQLFALTIDGDSTVHSSPATPPVPDGLRSMPQALMPKVQVGIEPHSFSDTVRALDIVVGLQRISSIPIETTVTTVKQAIDSQSPAVVIAADGWDRSDIALPVSAGTSGPIVINAVGSDGKPSKLELNPTLRFSSLQTVFNHGRSLLIATSNGVPAQLDELLNWLGGNGLRWPSIRGVAMVSVPGQDPVIIEGSNMAGPVAKTPESHSDRGWLWWIVGAWLAVAVVGAGVIVLRNRRGSLRKR